MRVHVCAVRMTLHRADVLEAYLNGQGNIQKATVYARTGDEVLPYRGSRKDAAALLAAYRFDNEELEVLVTSHDSRKINQEYQEKMVSLVAGRVFRKVFLPAPIAAAYVWLLSGGFGDFEALRAETVHGDSRFDFSFFRD